MDRMTDPGHEADVEFVGGPHHHLRLIVLLPVAPCCGVTMCLPFMRLSALMNLGPDDPVPSQEATYRLEPKGTRWLGVYQP